MIDDKGEAAEAREQGHWLARLLASPDVTVTTRAMMSFRVKYLAVAESAAESLVWFERDNVGLLRWYDEAFMRASVAYIMSAFAVEAAVNEAFVELEISSSFQEENDRQPTLAKAQALAALKGFEASKAGDALGQSVALLFKVRDAMAHPKAEWFSDMASHHKLSKRLEATGIKRSPFAKDGDVWFPIACMSGNAATWAVRVAGDYIAAFRTAVGLR